MINEIFEKAYEYSEQGTGNRSDDRNLNVSDIYIVMDGLPDLVTVPADGACRAILEVCRSSNFSGKIEVETAEIPSGKVFSVLHFENGVCIKHTQTEPFYKRFPGLELFPEVVSEKVG